MQFLVFSTCIMHSKCVYFQLEPHHDNSPPLTILLHTTMTITAVCTSKTITCQQTHNSIPMINKYSFEHWHEPTPLVIMSRESMYCTGIMQLSKMNEKECMEACMEADKWWHHSCDTRPSVILNPPAITTWATAGQRSALAIEKGGKQHVWQCGIEQGSTVKASGVMFVLVVWSSDGGQSEYLWHRTWVQGVLERWGDSDGG